MISITSPSSNSTVTPPFDVNGMCDSSHTVTVTIDGTNPLLQQSTRPNTRTGNWGVTFNMCPAGTYTITAKCGDPVESASVSNVQVT
jgi:hypothetical protein